MMSKIINDSWIKGVHRFLLVMMVLINYVRCQVKIQGGGINPLHRGDIGVVFWVSVQNIGEGSLIVSASMSRCCEYLGNGEMDCEHMKLIPSERELLLETGFVNLHLIYPNLYPHHRKGSCLVEVSAETAPISPGEALFSQASAAAACNDSSAADAQVSKSTFVVTQNVTFDTRVLLTHVPPLLKDYYDISEVKWKFDKDEYLNPTPETEVCDSTDEDPLDGCSPTDCAIKYSGSRNFFEPNLRRCVKVPLCLSDPNKELPNIAYIPNSNTCRDLENPITPEDMEFFKFGTADQGSPSNQEMGIKVMVVITLISVIMLFMVSIVLCWLCTRPCCFTWWRIKRSY